MSQLVALLNGTVTGLLADARLVGVNVSRHGGNFTDAEIRTYAKKSPHIVVACLRAVPELVGNRPRAEAAMVAVVLVMDKPGAALDRHTAALSLTDATLRVLSKLWAPAAPGNPAPVDGISRARNLDARNLFSPAWDHSGLAAWAISWTQTVTLKDEEITNTFDTLGALYDVTPRDNDPPLGEIPEAEDVLDLTT